MNTVTVIGLFSWGWKFQLFIFAPEEPKTLKVSICVWHTHHFRSKSDNWDKCVTQNAHLCHFGAKSVEEHACRASWAILRASTIPNHFMQARKNCTNLSFMPPAGAATSNLHPWLTILCLSSELLLQHRYQIVLLECKIAHLGQAMECAWGPPGLIWGR